MKQNITVRLIILVLILIFFVFVCYEVLLGNFDILREKVKSIEDLRTSSDTLEESSIVLEKKVTTDYEKKKISLKETIDEYEKTKKEYESISPTIINEIKDIYEVGFLWTIVGNYATEEGINLKFDVTRNTTSASSINNKSSDYIVCDLKFTIEGNYINLTDFIYDIEDDDRLNFEINNFEMIKSLEEKSDKSDKEQKNKLQVTLTVRAVKLYSDTLLQSMLYSNSSSNYSTSTQTVNANQTQKTGNDNTDEVLN